MIAIEMFKKQWYKKRTFGDCIVYKKGGIWGGLDENKRKI